MPLKVIKLHNLLIKKLKLNYSRQGYRLLKNNKLKSICIVKQFQLSPKKSQINISEEEKYH